MKDAKDSDGHILPVAPQPYYEPRGTPIAVHLLLDVLSELGYRVDVLTFPTGQAVSIPGVNIRRVWNPLKKMAPNIVVVCVGATDFEHAELASTLDDSVNQKLQIVKRQPGNVNVHSFAASPHPTRWPER